MNVQVFAAKAESFAAQYIQASLPNFHIIDAQHENDPEQVARAQELANLIGNADDIRAHDRAFHDAQQNAVETVNSILEKMKSDALATEDPTRILDNAMMAELISLILPKALKNVEKMVYSRLP